MNKNSNFNNKTYKISYISSSTWRKIFLVTDNEVYKDQTKFIYDRSSTIPPIFNGYQVKIYDGRRFNIRNVYSWLVGFKFGEFTWNRKLALYKAKQLRKKAKKKEKASK
jgi:ribosomal protein S19